MKKRKPTCVQCQKPMKYGTNWDKFVPVCFNPNCPNYGLLQMGEEAMFAAESRLKSKKKTKRGKQC